ncbi:MAG: N-acetylmuramoyl-L-alanine amidase family protein, partial [Lawsonibacter sp.]
MLICIDAGHGFYTPGKRCLKSIDPNETREWVLNSGIADKLQTLLSGYDCQTMRVDDVTGEMDISLKSRCSQANKANADVYVSI